MLEMIEHVLNHGRGLELMAGHLRGLHQGIAQAISVGRREKIQPPRQLGHEVLVLGHAIEKVRAN